MLTNKKIYDEQKAHALAAQMWKELSNARLADEEGNEVEFTHVDLIAAAGFFVHDVMINAAETTNLTFAVLRPLVMSIMDEASHSGIEDLLA